MRHVHHNRLQSVVLANVQVRDAGRGRVIVGDRLRGLSKRAASASASCTRGLKACMCRWPLFAEQAAEALATLLALALPTTYAAPTAPAYARRG